MGLLPPPDQVVNACGRVINFDASWQDVWIAFATLLIGTTCNAIFFFVCDRLYKRNVDLMEMFCGTTSFLSVFFLLFNDVELFLYVMWLPSFLLACAVWWLWFTLVWACARMLMFCLSFF